MRVVSVVANAAVLLGLGWRGLAQTGMDVRAYQLDQQMRQALNMAQIDGNLDLLANHVTVRSPGTVYTVRRSNVLIALYTLPQTMGEMAGGVTDPQGNPLVTTDAAIYAAPSCKYDIPVALLTSSSPPVSGDCRRELAEGKARFLKAGEQLLIGGYGGSMAAGVLRMTLLDHHVGPDGREAPRFVTMVGFQFDNGFLMNANANQIVAALRPFLVPANDPLAHQTFPDAALPVYSLEDKLNAMYNYSNYNGTDWDPDKVLKLKVGGLLNYNPVSDVYACAPVLQDGKVLPPSFGCKMQHVGGAAFSAAQMAQAVGQSDAGGLLAAARPPKGLFAAGQELELDSLTLVSKKDKDLLEMKVKDYSIDPQLGVPAIPSSHAAITFQFPKGYLATADVKDVAAAIGRVFDVETIPRKPMAGGGSFAAGGAAQPADPTAALNTVPLPAVAGPPPGLEEQLKAVYKLTLVGADQAVASRGTVLKVASDKVLLGTPVAKATLCPASVVDGKPRPPALACTTPLKPALAKGDAVFFSAGKKLDLTAVAVNLPKETVTLTLIDDNSDAGAGVASRPKFHTSINFVFPKGYLEEADAGQVSDYVGLVLPMVSATTAARN